MTTKQEFAEAYDPHQPGVVNTYTMYHDALYVMEAIEAQIPKARYRVGDRVKSKLLYDGDFLPIVEVRTLVQYRRCHAGEWLNEDKLEPAPIEPPTVEECIDALRCFGRTYCADLIDRYDAWKGSQA